MTIGKVDVFGVDPSFIRQLAAIIVELERNERIRIELDEQMERYRLVHNLQESIRLADKY